jgi:hypothetical protein
MSLVLATSKGVTINPEKDPANDPFIAFTIEGNFTSLSF